MSPLGTGWGSDMNLVSRSVLFFISGISPFFMLSSSRQVSNNPLAPMVCPMRGLYDVAMNSSKRPSIAARSDLLFIPVPVPCVLISATSDGLRSPRAPSMALV